MAQRAFPAVRTADELRRLPDDGNRYEIIDGVLYVTSSPTMLHQRAQMQMINLLFAYTESTGLELFAAPTAVRASEITEVQPDILALDPARLDPGEDRFSPMHILTLAVEILSPSTRHRDRGVKRRTYLANGVDDYWVIDLKRRAVDLWRPGAAVAEVRTDRIDWHPVPSHLPLHIDLRLYFARVLRDG